MDNQQIARTILTAVGPENITEAYNCMTRLRLRVKAVTVTKEELKKIAGVKGVIMNEGEIHIVLGPGFFTSGIRFETGVTGLSSTIVPSPPTEKP